jgi:EAL domain-containing protein (putative c-di-GMP-specific phosphodiesterase class I)/GGDEF domain-containing protein
MESKKSYKFDRILQNYKVTKDMMREKNYEYAKLFIYFGLLYSLLNFFFQGYFLMCIKIRYLLIMLLLFIFFLAFYQLKNDFVKKHATRFVYAIAIASLFITTLMGSLWNPHTVAVAYYVFLIAAPAFVLDRPFSHTMHIVASTLIFIIFIYTSEFKNHYTTFRIDLFASISFCMASIVLNQFLNYTRAKSIQYENQLVRSVEYDPKTSLKNEYALRRDEESYYNQDLYVAFIKIEDIQSLRAYFGLSVSEELDARLITALKHFTDSDFIYNYNDNNLVILGDASNERFLKMINLVKDEFSKSAKEYNNAMDVTLAIGYVYGIAANHNEFVKMIRSARDHLSEAEEKGHGQTVGEVFHKDEAGHLIRNKLNDDSTDVDPMTGAMTLTAFRVMAKELVGRLTGQKAILYINIEGLKSYNETFGFQAGDDLIIHLVNELYLNFDKKYISRLGEDHFAVLSNDLHIEERMQKVAESMSTFNPKAKVFICAGAYILKEGDSVIQACDRAKMACDLSRTRADEVLNYYDEALSDQVRFRNYVLSHIEEAAQKNHLKVFYQGVVDTKTKTTCGCEALVRWHDPTYGWIYPDHFIETLEEANLIHVVDLYVLAHVCKRIRERLDQGLIVYPVSINLSRQDFFTENFYENIIATVTRYKTPLKYLHLEVTERVMASNSTTIIETLKKLKAYGFAIWMDDFGSEYSSLNMMSKFHFDVIKLDMYFMRNFDASEDAKILIQSIIDLACKMGERSLCEGVENEEQYAFLKGVHCDMIQGYYFFKPVIEEEFLKKAKTYDDRGEN